MDYRTSKPGTDNVISIFLPTSIPAGVRKRIAIVRETRRFFEDRGFLEVETPILQTIPGGAAAEPFRTHHKALGIDLYLRIALGALLETFARGWLQQGIRNQPQLSQRRHLQKTQSRIHNARSLLGVCLIGKNGESG
jgi:hypothetical protein